MKCPLCEFEASHLDDWSIHIDSAHPQPHKIGCDERLTIVRDIIRHCGDEYDRDRPKIPACGTSDILSIIDAVQLLANATDVPSTLLALAELDLLIAGTWVEAGLERWCLPTLRIVRDAATNGPEISADAIIKMLEPYDK